MSGFALASAIDGGVDRAIKEAVDRGVRVRMVTEITSANLRDAQHFASFVELLHAAAPVTNRAIVIDRAGLLVFVSGEEGLGPTGEAQVALWTTSSDLLGRARQYHQRVWSQAIGAARRFVELDPRRRSSPSSRVASPSLSSASARSPSSGCGPRAFGSSGSTSPSSSRPWRIRSGGPWRSASTGAMPSEVGASLGAYYESHALGKLEVVRELAGHAPSHGLLRLHAPVARDRSGPRPKMIKTVLETRLGSPWEVSRPDPRRHASKGCVFTINPAV